MKELICYEPTHYLGGKEPRKIIVKSYSKEEPTSLEMLYSGKDEIKLYIFYGNRSTAHIVPIDKDFESPKKIIARDKSFKKYYKDRIDELEILIVQKEKERRDNTVPEWKRSLIGLFNIVGGIAFIFGFILLFVALPLGIIVVIVGWIFVTRESTLNEKPLIWFTDNLRTLDESRTELYDLKIMEEVK